MARIEEEIRDAIGSKIIVPQHVRACANAVHYDLMHGPSFSRLPHGDITQFTDDDLATYPDDLEKLNDDDQITETYCGPVADCLRSFIDDLPSELFYDIQSGEFLTKEPEGYEDEETGEWIEPFYEDYWRIENSDIVQALFGKIIAREFR